MYDILQVFCIDIQVQVLSLYIFIVDLRCILHVILNIFIMEVFLEENKAVTVG